MRMTAIANLSYNHCFLHRNVEIHILTKSSVDQPNSKTHHRNKQEFLTLPRDRYFPPVNPIPSKQSSYSLSFSRSKNKRDIFCSFIICRDRGKAVDINAREGPVRGKGTVGTLRLEFGWFCFVLTNFEID